MLEDNTMQAANLDKTADIDPLYNEIKQRSEDPGEKINAIIRLVASLYGPEKFVLQARKMGLLSKIRASASPSERLLAAKCIVFNDSSPCKLPSEKEFGEVISAIEDALVDLITQHTIGNEIQARINKRLEERREEYIDEMRRDVLRNYEIESTVRRIANTETSSARQKMEELEALEEKGLPNTALSVVRPNSLDEVVGQNNAINSLRAKIGTKYPQHVILYGPPGVGKTTVARLVLESLKGNGKSSFAANAPFVEVDATTLRWDYREFSNPLLGSVHDPIYQGAKRDLADDGVPEPKIGLVTKAHGGVLFMDEIGELEENFLNKLLKVLEDKRVTFESSYFDENDPKVPAYVKHLFKKGAPADFILIGATTRQPQEIPQAIRSRCSEVYFNPLTISDIKQIVCLAAKKINVLLEDGVAEEIGTYTTEGRKAVQLLTDVHGMVMDANGGVCETITLENVKSCIRINRLSSAVTVKASEKSEIGHVFGLGVSGFLGTCLEIETAVFNAHEVGKGIVRFNKAAGVQSQDSVFNASSALRNFDGTDINDYDVHVNIVGGGNIDGPSAGLAVSLALYSAVHKVPVRSDMAVTGEISVLGKVKPVGGIAEKLYGAVRAGMKRILVPYDNLHDVPDDLPCDVKVIPVSELSEAIESFRK